MRALAALLLALAVARPAAAEAGRPLSYTWSIEAPVTGVLGAAWLGTEFGKGALAPATCHWCHRQADGSVDVNGFDRAVRDALVGRGLTPPTWARVSDVTVFGLIPALSLAADLWLANDLQLDANFATDVAVIAEALIGAAVVDQAIKFGVARERPFVAFQSPYLNELRHGTETSADDNLSFYSGHSSAALSLTMAAARVIHLRTGSKLGYAVLIPLGVLGSLMRVAADKHWGSDVLTGMTVGAAAGFVVPTLHADF